MYGFVGAGEITAAIVEGLSAHTAEPPAIHLSPRGRAVGQELAGRFANVRVCASNQEVLDHADTIVLAVRPPMAREVLEALSFQPRHVLVSAMAGVPLEHLRDWAPAAGQLTRVIPLPQAASGHSLTALYPDNPVARGLFESVGTVVVPDEEASFDAFSAVTATFAAHLDYLATIATWLSEQGVDNAAATAYTTHIFGQLGQSLLDHGGALPALTEKHMTPGGNNEQFLADLRGAGVPGTVRHALDRILTRLRG